MSQKIIVMGIRDKINSKIISIALEISFIQVEICMMFLKIPLTTIITTSVAMIIWTKAIRRIIIMITIIKKTHITTITMTSTIKIMTIQGNINKITKVIMMTTMKQKLLIQLVKTQTVRILSKT